MPTLLPVTSKPPIGSALSHTGEAHADRHWHAAHLAPRVWRQVRRNLSVL
jgi:hypothetical protein